MYPTGSVNSRAGIVRAPADDLWVWKHPYDQSSGHHAGPCGSHTGLRIPIRSVMWGCRGFSEGRKCTY